MHVNFNIRRKKKKKRKRNHWIEERILHWTGLKWPSNERRTSSPRRQNSHWLLLSPIQFSSVQFFSFISFRFFFFLFHFISITTMYVYWNISVHILNFFSSLESHKGTHFFFVALVCSLHFSLWNQPNCHHCKREIHSVKKFST